MRLLKNVTTDPLYSRELFNDVWPRFQNAPLLHTALLLLSQKLSQVSLSLGSH